MKRGITLGATRNVRLRAAYNARQRDLTAANTLIGKLELQLVESRRHSRFVADLNAEAMLLLDEKNAKIADLQRQLRVAMRADEIEPAKLRIAV